MVIVAVICALVLATVVVLIVSAPLRRGAALTPKGEGMDADLEAARDVKYREIRDAELDYRTGKLSEQDYRAIDAELKAQALELLDEIERREASPRR